VSAAGCTPSRGNRGARDVIRVGCSGWVYKHWAGDFYPAGLPAPLWFDHYRAVFDTVEINNSFYRLPEWRTFAAWGARARTPGGAGAPFLFAVKASRFLTHMKRLIDPEEPIDRLLRRARHLGPTLGPILYQLPPRWVPDVGRFEEFLAALPKTIELPRTGRRVPLRHTVEFRDARAYEGPLPALLERYGVALCLHDMKESVTPRATIGPFVYVRFHGTSRYGGRYPDDHLAGWAAWLRQAHGTGRDVFVYFNNDTGGHAPRDAARLRALLADGDQVAVRPEIPGAVDQRR
jgi:uncharacterized protein YecE (DUF72 family)